MKALATREIQDCLERLEPASLAVTKHVIIKIELLKCCTQHANVPKIDIQAQIVRLLSNLLTIMSALETLTLDIETTMEASQLFAPVDVQDAWHWPFLMQSLLKRRPYRAVNPSLCINLRSVALKSNGSLEGLASFISQFDAVKIHRMVIGINEYSQEFDIEPATLLRLRACNNIENLQIESELPLETVCRAAANLPTTTLRFGKSWLTDTWAGGDSSSLETMLFADLKSIQIDCESDVVEVSNFLWHLNAPKLSQIVLEDLRMENFYEIMITALEPFLPKHPHLQDIKIGLIRDWSEETEDSHQFQRILRNFRETLHLSNIRLSLTMFCTGPSLEGQCFQSGTVLPIDKTFQEHIEKVTVVIDSDTSQPPYRVSRVCLPNILELAIGLYGSPLQAGIVQWYLDGLDLPGLNSLTLSIGECPRLAAPVIAYLPLLPRNCVVQVSHDSLFDDDVNYDAAEMVETFEASEHYADLVRTCVHFGIELVFQGEHWVKQRTR